jgi:tagatose 1,6-diphosphate aldolase GatY/KbaY
MIQSTSDLLKAAQDGGYAIGAFNVYNLEGVLAVVAAAESEGSPAILQIHPASLRHGGKALIAMCLTAAQESSVPMSVHLDHSASSNDIKDALDMGMTSIMADGSELDYEGNMDFTRDMANLVREQGGSIEAELGRLAGTEDDFTVPENLAKLTDPDQAADFVSRTGIDALAVCIRNAHGRYRVEPRLDFERLAAIRSAVDVPLVLHGASGLPESAVRRSIELGVCKFNVNTEVREAYNQSLKADLTSAKPPDLAALMQNAVDAMKAVVSAKIRLFGSKSKA